MLGLKIKFQSPEKIKYNNPDPLYRDFEKEQNFCNDQNWQKVVFLIK